MKSSDTLPTDESGLQAQIETDLLNLYGPVLASKEVAKVLGFTTVQAFRQAILKGRLEIPLFRMAGKRSRFALTKEIAGYVATQRMALDLSCETPLKKGAI